MGNATKVLIFGSILAILVIGVLLFTRNQTPDQLHTKIIDTISPDTSVLSTTTTIKPSFGTTLVDKSSSFVIMPNRQNFNNTVTQGGVRTTITALDSENLAGFSNKTVNLNNSAYQNGSTNAMGSGISTFETTSSNSVVVIVPNVGQKGTYFLIIHPDGAPQVPAEYIGNIDFT